MSDQLVEMVRELADRAISGKKSGYGSPESRSAALVMRAIDDLALAAQTDPSFSSNIYKVIDQLKQIFSGEKVEKKPPTEGEEKSPPQPNPEDVKKEGAQKVDEGEEE